MEFYLDEQGLEQTEYAILGAVVLVAAIGAWHFLGEAIVSLVNNIAATIGGGL